MQAEGGIAAVVTAMSSEDPDVQENTCDALGWLAEEDEYRATIVAAGGVPAVIAAMRRHADSSDVQRCVYGSAVWPCIAHGCRQRAQEWHLCLCGG